MPQGKGTYGSKVGRPPKKKYDKGGGIRVPGLGKLRSGELLERFRNKMASDEVDPFSTRNEEGVPAQQVAEAMESQNEAQRYMAIPTANAMDRKQVSPDTEQYKDGGKVEKTKKKVFTGEKNVTDVVKAVEKKLKKEKAKWKEHTIFGPQFKKDVS